MTYLRPASEGDAGALWRIFLFLPNSVENSQCHADILHEAEAVETVRTGLLFCVALARCRCSCQVEEWLRSTLRRIQVVGCRQAPPPPKQKEEHRPFFALRFRSQCLSRPIGSGVAQAGSVDLRQRASSVISRWLASL